MMSKSALGTGNSPQKGQLLITSEGNLEKYGNLVY